MYNLIFKKDASKYYKKCDQREKARLNKVFDALEKNGVTNLDCKELKGELSGLKRIRVGDTRIIIEEKNEEFIILLIAPRGDVYK
ncbi:MAG TPA: type II toxin-antitoxin system RelE/ParE family toxin [Leptospiraceae bacterium]|nr:type II toxin-antitoxin system RelE/ParE family toxin [Leptospiraceae bacterium]HRG76042.1 type II toxin-antitoxin system RelE/ParE family toxin [Leptospiraceae bacterium]